MPLPVRLLSPADRDAPIWSGKRPVLCSVRGKLMDNHCHNLTSLCSQHDFRTVQLGVAILGIGGQLALNKLRYRDASPPVCTQQFLGPCHGLDSPVECRHESDHRPILNRGLRNDGANGREGVLHAMVELSDQYTLTFLSTFARGHVDVDAHYPRRTPIIVVENESTRLEPSNLTTRANNTVLKAKFAPALQECPSPYVLDFVNIIAVHAGLQLATCYLACPLGKAVNRCITLRNRHLLRVDVVRVAGIFCPLAIGDIAAWVCGWSIRYSAFQERPVRDASFK